MIKKRAAANTFLIELIIVILFFSLCIATTLQLFVIAHQKSELNKNTNIALIKVQSTAESLNSLNNQNNMDFLVENMRKTSTSGEYEIWYDSKWNIEMTTPTFKQLIEIDEDTMSNGLMLTIKVKALDVSKADSEKVLCEITAKKYFQGMENNNE